MGNLYPFSFSFSFPNLLSYIVNYFQDVYQGLIFDPSRKFYQQGSIYFSLFIIHLQTSTWKILIWESVLLSIFSSAFIIFLLYISYKFEKVQKTSSSKSKRDLDNHPKKETIHSYQNESDGRKQTLIKSNNKRKEKVKHIEKIVGNHKNDQIGKGKDLKGKEIENDDAIVRQRAESVGFDRNSILMETSIEKSKSDQQQENQQQQTGKSVDRKRKHSNGRHKTTSISKQVNNNKNFFLKGVYGDEILYDKKLKALVKSIQRKWGETEHKLIVSIQKQNAREKRKKTKRLEQLDDLYVGSNRWNNESKGKVSTIYPSPRPPLPFLTSILQHHHNQGPSSHKNNIVNNLGGQNNANQFLFEGKNIMINDNAKTFSENEEYFHIQENMKEDRNSRQEIFRVEEKCKKALGNDQLNSVSLQGIIDKKSLNESISSPILQSTTHQVDSHQKERETVDDVLDYSAMFSPQTSNYLMHLHNPHLAPFHFINQNHILAFESLSQWKIFGGKDIPLLLEITSNTFPLFLQHGEILLQEGKTNLYKNCLYILKGGRFQVSVNTSEYMERSVSGRLHTHRTDKENKNYVRPIAQNLNLPSFEQTKSNENSKDIFKQNAIKVQEETLETVSEPGSILASIVDFMAIVIGKESFESCVTVTCVEANTEVLVVPIPVGLDISYVDNFRKQKRREQKKRDKQRKDKSQNVYHHEENNSIQDSAQSIGVLKNAKLDDLDLDSSSDGVDQKVSFSRVTSDALSRLLRMCIVRLNRVTLMSAYCQLGILYSLPPTYTCYSIPESIKSYFSKVDSLYFQLANEKRENKNRTGDTYKYEESNSSEGREVQQNLQHLIRSILGGPQELFIPSIELPRLRFGNPVHGLHKKTEETTSLKNGDLSLTLKHMTPKKEDIKDVLQTFSKIPDMHIPSIVLRNPGEPIFHPTALADENSCPCMYIVLRGEVEVESSLSVPLGASLFNTNLDNSPSFAANSTIYKYGLGTVFGYLSLLTGSQEEWYLNKPHHPSLLEVRASSSSGKRPVWLLAIPKNYYDVVLRHYPYMLSHATNLLLDGLPRSLRIVDFGMKYRQIYGGDKLIHQGEPSHGTLYILLSGRVRVLAEQDTPVDSPSLTPKEDSKQEKKTKAFAETFLSKKLKNDFSTSIILAELGRGALIGESELLTGANYATSVQALRLSGIAYLGAPTLSFLTRRHPQVLNIIARHVAMVTKTTNRSSSSLLSDRSNQAMANSFLSETFVPKLHHSLSFSNGSQHKATKINDIQSDKKLISDDAKTVLIVPISMSVPLDLFTYTLKAALAYQNHRVKVINSYHATSTLGLEGSDLRFEDINIGIESWLIQQEEQCEILLFLGDWTISEWNKFCAHQADIVLLVGNAKDPPLRSHLERELHKNMRNAKQKLVLLHLDPSPFYKPSGTKTWVSNRPGISEHIHVRLHSNGVDFDQRHYRSDFHRLARILTDTAVGLVLGGGGARGISQVGVLRALEEHQIPIDYIGGTSIGAFVGALYASSTSYLNVSPISRWYANSMSNFWAYLMDFTLPFTSYFNGNSFSRSIRKAIGDTKIEDCWLNYFCVTVDLSTSRQRNHDVGRMWRFVRASMSLAGYLPPVCVTDTDNEIHYLVDGGYVNNLPADVMKEQHDPNIIIAVDVASDGPKMTGEREDYYGDTLYGMRILLDYINPFSRKNTFKAPSLSEISSQLCYLQQVAKLEEAREKYIDFYMKPPVQFFGLLDWQREAELHKIGYDYALKVIEKWKAEGHFSKRRKLDETERSSRMDPKTPGPLTFQKSFQEKETLVHALKSNIEKISSDPNDNFHLQLTQSLDGF